MNGPQSIKALLRADGVPLGGAVRAKMSKAIDDVLWVTWLAAIAETGSTEDATLVVFGLLAADPTYRPPLWLGQTFRRHRVAIVNAVALQHVGR